MKSNNANKGHCLSLAVYNLFFRSLSCSPTIPDATLPLFLQILSVLYETSPLHTYIIASFSLTRLFWVMVTPLHGEKASCCLLQFTQLITTINTSCKVPPRVRESATGKDRGISSIFPHSSTDGLDTDDQWEQWNLLHAGDYRRRGNYKNIHVQHGNGSSSVILSSGAVDPEPIPATPGGKTGEFTLPVHHMGFTIKALNYNLPE